jgi:DNA-directed RNA polymerase specialized sigma24 family protein
VTDESEQQRRAEFAKGNTDIWREFISREIPLLYGMFMKRWPNPSLAEELVQKTVFDAVRGCGSYDPSRGSPEEWIFGIARNNILLEMRKRASRPVVIVRSALSRLESKEQALLRAKYIEGLSARDIAQQMDITEKAVHSLLYRARISLREQLKRVASLHKEGQKS